MKKYKVTIRNRGFFGYTHTINITDVGKGYRFTRYENGCFELYGIKDDKTYSFILPLDKIDWITIDEI